MATRADDRRHDKEIAKERQYAKSGFRLSRVAYRPIRLNRSKYKPHIGKKQRAKAAAFCRIGIAA